MSFQSFPTACAETTDHVNKICEYKTKLEELPEITRRLHGDFSRTMEIEYIHKLNIGELIGTQGIEETQSALLQVNKADSDLCNTVNKMGRDMLETQNTYAALNYLQKVICQEMNKTGLLTVQQICDVHRILLSGLDSRAGELRSTSVCTEYRGNIHWYPEPAAASEIIYTIVDRHNLHMDRRPRQASLSEDTWYIFNCAAWLLFHVVNIHPFPDGNGRTCRLLANYVLSLVTPFPVPLYHPNREDFVDAIVHCREQPEEGLQNLVAMLVEGAWRSWNCLFTKIY